MKIIVISNFPMDSNYANAINTVKLADGFANLGHKVIIICRDPNSKDFLKKDFFRKYMLNKSVEIKSYRFFRKLYFIDQYFFALQILKDLFFLKPDFVYARDYISPCFSSLLSINTVSESHAYPENKSLPLLLMVNGLQYLTYFRGLITISPILKESFLEKGVPERKIKILYDCVDLKLFSKTKETLNYKNKTFTVLYSGHLYKYKGIDTILKSAKLLPDIKFEILGGHPSDINLLKQSVFDFDLKNVSILGFVDFSDVPKFLFKADLLLLPPSGKHSSANWTSPVKLGEYLASKTPILASNIPALINFLTNEEVFFFDADDPNNLAEMILFIKDNDKLAFKKAERGYKKAITMSYDLKAKQIIDFFNIE